MRIQSYDPANEPLLGELAGRWYFNQHTQRFEQNRRHSERRRRQLADSPPPPVGIPVLNNSQSVNVNVNARARGVE